MSRNWPGRPASPALNPAVATENRGNIASQAISIEPDPIDSLLAIDGIGSKKLAAYGEAFLSVIAGMDPEDAAALVAA